MDFFDYNISDWIACECGCGQKAIDIHHLDSRGMGGSRSKDVIENLVAVSRKCHEKAESDKEFNEQLRMKHLDNIKNRAQGQ